jgi:hypothetical protein
MRYGLALCSVFIASRRLPANSGLHSLTVLLPLNKSDGSRRIKTTTNYFDINRCLTYPHGPTTHLNLLLVNGHEEAHPSNRSTLSKEKKAIAPLPQGNGSESSPHTYTFKAAKQKRDEVAKIGAARETN